MAISDTLGQGSWARYSPINSVNTLSGVDLTNPKSTTWFGMFSGPDLSDRDGDIEYTIQSGDRLDKLAFRYYGDALLWWVIAQRNEIDLPVIEAQSGRRIIIPDPSFVATQISGRKPRRSR